MPNLQAVSYLCRPLFEKVQTRVPPASNRFDRLLCGVFSFLINLRHLRQTNAVPESRIGDIVGDANFLTAGHWLFVGATTAHETVDKRQGTRPHLIFIPSKATTRLLSLYITHCLYISVGNIHCRPITTHSPLFSFTAYGLGIYHET